MEPGARCTVCEDRAYTRWMTEWAAALALRIELGEDVIAGQWYENDGDSEDRQATIATRAEPPPRAMSARAYDAWCEAYWRRWGLVRRWTGLPPELPLVRWVETWFFDVPIEDFDPESDVEIRGYPARAVVDVATGSYL